MPKTPKRSIARRALRAVAGRTDAPAPQPAGPPPGPVVPIPVAPEPSDFWKRSRARLDSIRNTITGIGEDKVQAGRPDIYRQALAYNEKTAMWRWGGIARRFVEQLPNDATRKKWTVKSEGRDIGADLVAEHKRLGLFTEVCDADKWGRLYGGAWIMMVTTEDMTGTQFADVEDQTGMLAQPLELDRVVTLDNLVVLDWSEVTPQSYDNDIRSPTFREPSHYRITVSTGGHGRDSIAAGQLVHTSRLVYFHGAKLPATERHYNGGTDDSVLEAVWDKVRNAETTSHALAAIATEMKITTLKMRDLPDVGTSDESAYFDTRMRLMSTHKSVLNSVLLADGEEYTHHPGTVSGMAELNATMRQDLQAVTGMPEQLWLGNAPGGLSSDGESHRNLWANVISSYQTTKYSPLLEAIYTVMFAAREGPWAGVAPDDWVVYFNPLDEMTQKGIADQRLVVAQSDAIYAGLGVLDPQHIATGRFGEDGWQDDLPPVDETGFGGLDIDVGALLAAVAEGDDSEAAATAAAQALAAGQDPAAAAAGAPALGAAAPIAADAPVESAVFEGLNGAQISAVLQVVEQLSEGVLAPDSARILITAAGVPPEKAAALIAAQVALNPAPVPALGPDGLPAPVVTADDEEAARKGAAMDEQRRLAAELTTHGAERCQHGKVNRCQMCGVERRRGVQTGPDGQALKNTEGEIQWVLEWRAIGDMPPKPAEPDADPVPD